MDGRHFDTISKRFASGVSRRQTLKTIAVGVAAVLLGRPPTRRALAADDLGCCKCVGKRTCESDAPSQAECNSVCGGAGKGIYSTKHTCEKKICRLKLKPKASGAQDEPADLSWTPRSSFFEVSGYEVVAASNFFSPIGFESLAGETLFTGFDTANVTLTGHDMSYGLVNPAASTGTGDPLSFSERIDIHRFALPDEATAIAFLEANFAALPPGFADVTFDYGVGSPAFAVIAPGQAESGAPSVRADHGSYFDRFVTRVQVTNYSGPEQPDLARDVVLADVDMFKQIFDGALPGEPRLGFAALRFEGQEVATFMPLAIAGTVIPYASDTPAVFENRQIQVGDAVNAAQNSFTANGFRFTNVIFDYGNPDAAMQALRGLPVSLRPVLDAQMVSGQVVSPLVDFLERMTTFEFARAAPNEAEAEAGADAMVEMGITVWGVDGAILYQVSIRDTIAVPAADQAAQEQTLTPIRTAIVDTVVDYSDLLHSALTSEPAARLNLLPAIPLSSSLARGG